MSWEEREAHTVGDGSANRDEPVISEEMRKQIEQARGGGSGASAPAKQKLGERKEQAVSKLAQVRDKVAAVAPGPVQKGLAQVQEQAGQRPVPAAFLAGLVLGWLLGKNS